MAVGYLLFGLLAGLAVALLTAEALSLGPAGIAAMVVLTGNAALLVAALLRLVCRRDRLTDQGSGGTGPSDFRRPDRST
ncbi:hypothetical protein DLJ49_09880 [Rhodovulum sp. 12E13]|uniref:hypothetical protein n=1 Tax=Rhodovulum sp. 12E13 TaxID=2203891 RepID=UPI000E164233|nr:hypothetical protein [Rhodovulum sp. 12E13]RDC72528.1 hypothetical protein DLJ49_09880 [Rhodovulum sp. 12E13]